MLSSGRNSEHTHAQQVTILQTTRFKYSVKNVQQLYKIKKHVKPASNQHNSNIFCVRIKQGQKDFAIILAKIRDTAIINRLYIKLYIKFVANNGKNHDSVHAAISFCPWNKVTIVFV